MKVAICISGQPRRVKICVPTIKKYLIDPVSKYAEIDLFLRSSNDWYIEGFLESLTENKIEYEYLEVCKDIPLPLKRIGLLQCIDRVHSPICFQRWLQQTYYVMMCNNKKKEKENAYGFKYDWVIRSRFDFEHFNEIEDLSKLIPDGIHFPNINNHSGVCDQFAIGPSNLMDLYSDRFLGIYKYDESVSFWNPEKELEYWLSVNKVLIKRTDLQYAIIREERYKAPL